VTVLKSSPLDAQLKC